MTDGQTEPQKGTGGQVPLETPPASSQEVIQQQSAAQDYVVLRLAVFGLILAIVIALTGVLVLSFFERSVPDGIIAIGSAAVGAMSTMLIRPPLFPAAPAPRGSRDDRRS